MDYVVYRISNIPHSKLNNETHEAMKCDWIKDSLNEPDYAPW